MLSSMIFSLLAVVLFVFFMLYKRKFFAGILPSAQPQITELQQQLEQTADEVITRMENQIAHLEYLLEVADEKIARLEELVQTSGSGNTSQDNGILMNMPAEPLKFQPVILPPELPELVQKTVQVRCSEGSEGSEVQNHPGSGDDKRRLILAMAEQGYSITEIAKATGKGKGEIMLILQLHKK